MPEGVPLDGVFTLRFFLWVVVPILWCVAGVTLIYWLDILYGNVDGQFGNTFKIARGGEGVVVGGGGVGGGVGGA